MKHVMFEMCLLLCIYVRKKPRIIAEHQGFCFKKNCILVCHFDTKLSYTMLGVHWCRPRYTKPSAYIMFVLFLKKEL